MSMHNMVRPGSFFVSLFLSVTFMIVFAVGVPLAASPEYIPSTRPVPTGLAPHMQVKLLHQGLGARSYAVIFYKGDEAFSGMADFAKQYHVGDAHFTAIGAASSALVSWYDLERKAYLALPLKEQAEVTSFMGDIAMFKGKPVVHAHAALIRRNGSAAGGHVFELHVNPTLEVFVTVDDTVLQKNVDPVSGLELIDPSH